MRVSPRQTLPSASGVWQRFNAHIMCYINFLAYVFPSHVQLSIRHYPCRPVDPPPPPPPLHTMSITDKPLFPPFASRLHTASAHWNKGDENLALILLTRSHKHWHPYFYPRKKKKKRRRYVSLFREGWPTWNGSPSPCVLALAISKATQTTGYFKWLCLKCSPVRTKCSSVRTRCRTWLHQPSCKPEVPPPVLHWRLFFFF